MNKRADELRKGDLLRGHKYPVIDVTISGEFKRLVDVTLADGGALQYHRRTSVTLEGR